ncbi:GNAT family N-acetyltransferase [Plantactinospora sonchi]|uniref:GNAT family N-acetyltransferase n=1 Tax=Plantactinospora sonchi TaxID=1544735 RepID=A0ABU7S5H8_9ACTN
MTRPDPAVSTARVPGPPSRRTGTSSRADLVDPVVRAAGSAADAAGRAAGVEVREVSDLAGLREVCQLVDGIWRPDPTDPPITVNLLRALTKAGNYVAGAYDGGRLVGTCMAFFGPPERRTMHSHIAGVSGAVQGRRVGFALKLHQRAWALHRGVSTIAWTFDPLVCRNAYFNLVKLAAVPAQYLPNVYGPMNDGINGDDDTDRLLLRWDLAAPAVVAACAGSVAAADAEAERNRGAVVALDRSPRDQPLTRAVDGDVLLVAVPPDITALRRADPATARRWRVALRDVLAPLLTQGARVTGFDRSGWYVVNRTAARES